MTDFLEEIGWVLDGFSSEERAVSRAVFRRILDGDAARAESLAPLLGLAPDTVETAVAGLVERGTMARDPESGDLVGARGLTLAKTRHQLTLAGRVLYAYCALDAVGIPVALALDARVESRCHACECVIHLTVESGAVIAAPAETVIWAAEREPRRSLREYT
jgi:alkylmercury lyase